MSALCLLRFVRSLARHESINATINATQERRTTASEHPHGRCAFYSRPRPHTMLHGVGDTICGGVIRSGVGRDGSGCGGVCGGFS